MRMDIRIEGTYAERGHMEPHHLLREVVVIGDGGVRSPYRDGHVWLNAIHAGFPDDIEVGSRVRFWATLFSRKGKYRLTAIREVHVV